MISYEGSKWYVRCYRKRWYFYAIFLYIKAYMKLEIWVDLLLYNKLEKRRRKDLRQNWREIKYHVELSKMYKFSTKRKYEK